MKPLHTFNIKASYRTSHFMEVNIHKTFIGMQNHCHWFTMGVKCRGAFSPEEHVICDKKKCRKTPQLGQFNFQLKHLGTEVIVHECAHAALTFARRKKLNLDENYGGGAMKIDCAEEQFCYALGYMARQIVAKIYELGLMK